MRISKKIENKNRGEREGERGFLLLMLIIAVVIGTTIYFMMDPQSKFNPKHLMEQGQKNIDKAKDVKNILEKHDAEVRSYE